MCLNIAIKSYWQEFAEDVDGPLPVTNEQLAQPFEQIPPLLELTPEEQSWIDDFRNCNGSYTGEQLAAFHAASRKCQRPLHPKLKFALAQTKSVALDRGFKIPDEFVEFLENDALVSRLYFPCNWFELDGQVWPCPVDSSYGMVLFLCESQGCNYTQLLLGPDGDHSITRTLEWYHERSQPTGSASFEVYHYADNFAEFLCRASLEQRANELDCAHAYFRQAEDCYRREKIQEAVLLYKVALSYDPSSAHAAERLNELT